MTTATTATTTIASGLSESAGGIDSLKAQLSAFGLDTRGRPNTLRRRLKKHLAVRSWQDVCSEPASTKDCGSSDRDASDADERLVALGDPEQDCANGSQILTQTSPISRISKQPLEYYICFDIEATCVEGGSFDYLNEIIEFPAILLNSQTFEIIAEFHSYVRPTMNAVLTEFCMALTGITQEKIDVSPIFPEMLCKFQEFLEEHGLFYNHSCAFITDGPWDIRDFIRKQCQVSNIQRPAYFSRPWVDIRSLHAEFYGLKKCNIEGMLAHRGLKFQGRQHSGIDDARNVAIIARRMWEDGAVLKPNSNLPNWTKKGKGSKHRSQRT